MLLDELIEDHLGPFGQWQKYAFLAAGAVLFPANLFFPTFVGFVPEFRCRIPGCDRDNGSSLYREPFTQFAIPPQEGDEFGPNRCVMRPHLSGQSGACTPESFDENASVTCYDSVYDGSVFENSLVTELDIGPCASLRPEWLPGTVVSKLALTEISFWLGVIIGCTAFGRFVLVRFIVL